MLEIIMLIGGLYAVITGKIPSSFYGGKDYVIESGHARLIGLLMMAPVPLSLIGGFMLGIMFGPDGVNYTFFCELAIVIIVAILAVVAMRQVRKPVPLSEMPVPAGPAPQ